MVDMNEQQELTEIDAEEVLREYGLDNITQTATIVQRISDNNSIINIPNGLEPPNIIQDSNESQSDSEELNAILSVNEENYPEQNPDTALTEERSNHDADPVADILNTDSLLGTVETPVEAQSLDTSIESTEESVEKSTEELIKLLPVNSKSFEIDDSVSRFSGAAWFHAIQQATVTLAGLGGIGGYVYYCLSRMKPKQIFLYDDDIVETANLSGQLYSVNMIGSKKVDAMACLGREFSKYHSTIAIPTKFTSENTATDIMICGFDNMEARKGFFKAWLKHIVNNPNAGQCLFIDGRLNIEEFQVFCMKGDDTFNIQKYKDEYLFDDWEAEGVECSMKQTTYCSNMIGSIIVNLFTNFVANTLTVSKPLIDRDLPFKTYYNASMMYFKTML